MATERTSKNGPASSLELLWGDRQRPTRGPKPGMSVAKIVRTAITIADADGLESVSMQRIAAKLGYTTMSLYRYVPGKDQLFDVLYDVALGKPPEQPEGGKDWRGAVDRWVRATLEVYARHPWLLRLQTTSPPIGPNQLAWFDALLRPLSGIGLADEEMTHLVMFVSSAVRDLARISTELGQNSVSVQQMGEGYAQELKRLVDEDGFAVLARVVSTGTFEPDGRPYNDILPSLEFGLQRLLDGVEHYVNPRRRKRK
jgi:AcrR family transcriptional regulator